MTGLDYYVSRSYDPVVGQFLSADTILGNTVGMNPYSYVAGNPETFVDPTGHFMEGSGGAAGAIGDGNFEFVPASSLGGNDDSSPSSIDSASGGTSEGTTSSTDDGGSDTSDQDMNTSIGPTVAQEEQQWAQDLHAQEWRNEQQRLNSEENDTPPTLNNEENTTPPTHSGETNSAPSDTQPSEQNQSLCGEGLSFAYQTPVATVTGEQAIGTLKVGEKVWANNPQTEKMELEPIQHIWLSHDNDLVNMTLVTTVKGPYGKLIEQKEVLHTNEKHPFLTTEKGFIPVSQLKPGMHVRKANGSYGVVTQLVIVPGAMWMYNLTIAQDHTYVVGSGQWIVHNATCTVKDLSPAHSPETSGSRPELQNLSDQELLNAVNNPSNGDPIPINTSTGNIVDGNGRAYELLRHAQDPGSVITPDTPIYYEPYTPAPLSEPWEEPPGFWDLSNQLNEEE